MNARQSLLGGLAALSACSSGQQQTTPRPQRASADVITQEQMRAGAFRNAYDAVQALHGNWLIVRNVAPSTANAAPSPAPADTSRTGMGARVGRPTAPQEPERGAPGMNSGIQVYLDGARIGGVQELRRIPASNIHSIRRISATEAQTRFGVGHSNGAIAVLTKPDSP